MKLSPFGQPLPANEKRLILGEPSQQLFPVKYQFCWDRYLTAQANHWPPNDVSLGQDRYDYTHNLTDEERWMFDWALSMLTTQDISVLLNLEEGIERHLTCPEASMYLGRQTDEETIHTWSYQLIVESLALDENVVYERYLRERSLYNKVEYAHGFHRRLMELRMDDHHSHAAIGEFIVCLAFWALVMEGGWFFAGFNWIYALRDRKLMPGTAELFQYIQRDEQGHRDFWVDVINTLVKEYPSAYTLDVQGKIANIIKDGTHLEDQYAADVCHNVLGISSSSYMGHFRHEMNQNLQRIGLEPVFTLKDSQPLAFVNKYRLQQEGSFFEVGVREYQKGSLTGWGDSTGMPDSVMRNPT